VRPLPLALTLALALSIAGSTSVHAAEPKAAAESKSALADAADKWEQGMLTEAAPLYEKALADGGLFPPDVVIAYSRIGTVHAAMGKKEAALSAFRVAAVIDPAFQLPAESGPIAKKLYEQARKDSAKHGGRLEITLEAPERAEGGKGFTIVAKVPESFAPVVEKLGIEVRDSLSKTPAWKSDQPSMASVSFDVPGKVVQGGTTLVIRVSALDQHANRWAMHESRIKVKESKTDAAAAVAEPPSGDEDENKSKKGFWSSPWPYVIGGVIVVGAVSTYFLTRPAEQVSVGAPAWR
jgi:hypothetical protein